MQFCLFLWQTPRETAASNEKLAEYSALFIRYANFWFELNLRFVPLVVCVCLKQLSCTFQLTAMATEKKIKTRLYVNYQQTNWIYYIKWLRILHKHPSKNMLEHATTTYLLWFTTYLLWFEHLLWKWIKKYCQ